MELGKEPTPQQNRMIPRQVFEAQVGQILQQKAIDEMELEAGPEEIYQYLKDNPPPSLMANPAFQTDSVFDTTKYLTLFLNNPQNLDNPQVQQLEQQLKNMIIPAQRLQQLLQAGVHPSNAEVTREYRARNEKAVFEYAKVSHSAFPIEEDAVTDEMIEQYYRAHPDSFREESQAQLAYVRIPKKPTPQDERVYRQELLEIKESIESGESTFEEEAIRESEDEGSARNGGDLGWFRKGMMVPAFEEVAFTLDSGEISDPVETAYGMHLIMVEGRRETDQGTEVKARHILRKVMPTPETVDSLEELAENMRVAAIGGEQEEENPTGDLKAAVSGFEGFEVNTTGLFAKGETMPDAGYIPGAGYFAFTAEPGAISELIEDTHAFFLLQLVRRTDKGVLPLDDVRESIRQTLTEKMQKERAREYLRAAAEKLDAEASLMSMKDSDSLISVAVSDTVSRRDFVPGVGYNTKPVAAAFGGRLNTRSGIVEGDGAYFLVRPTWRETIEEVPAEDPQLASIRQELKAGAGQRAYFEWYTALKNSANVEDRLNDYYMN
jgi:parvulin-like peptidyl-prolyl isomerase